MYHEKQKNYFQNVRKELLDLIPIENRNGLILEIGAGTGSTLIYAKDNNYASKIYGIELCDIEESFQKSKEFEEFIIGNIENIDLPFQENMFDVIICADVLEHLVDPYIQVSKLQKLLKKDGIFIASIPNIREWNVLKDIVFKGDFKYVNAGILDKTHLRFFCKKNMINLFTDNGNKITNIQTNLSLHGGKRNIFNKLTFGLFEEFLVTQYFIVSKTK